MRHTARSIFKNLVALGIGFILSLVLLEIALQIYNPLETRLRGDSIVLPAEKRYVFKNPGLAGLDSTITHTKNALGFRGPPLPADGLDNYMSLITVGGSTTECLYLSDGKTWPDLLAAKLHAEWMRLWLNNAGLDGHSTFGHLILLRDFVLPLKPKVVLFLVGLNDVNASPSVAFASAHTAAHLKGRILWSSMEGFVKSSAAYSEVMSLALNLYRYAYAWRHGLAHQPVDLRAVKQVTYPEAELTTLLDDHRQTYLPAYEKRLRSIIHLTREHKAEPILITQPMLYGDGVDEATGVDLAGLFVDPYSGYSAWAILELYNDVTRQVGLSEGVTVVDLAAELPKNSALFYDYSHYTNEGAAEVASIIHRHISPMLQERFGEQ